jgi:hypothetical protein
VIAKSATSNAMINRVRVEFLEMPGLSLKRDQVQRLCGIERTMCQLVLDALVDARFLYTKSDGQYARLTEGSDVTRARTAKAIPDTAPRAVRAS